MNLAINLDCQPSPNMSGDAGSLPIFAQTDEAGIPLTDEAGNLVGPEVGIQVD